MIDDLIQFNEHETIDTQMHVNTVQKPRLVQDPDDKKYVNKYTYYFRKMDAAVKGVFENNIYILDESKREFSVPVIMGTVQKAIEAIFGSSSTRMDNDSGQVKRVLLPVCCIFPGATAMEAERFISPEARIYQGYGDERIGNDIIYGRGAGVPITRKYEVSFVTREMEHMNMILSQALVIFSQHIDFHIGGDFFQSTLMFESSQDNFTKAEEADNGIRLYKWTAVLSFASWLPQPVLKSKTILRQKTEVVATDDVNNPKKTNTDIIARTLLDKNGTRTW